VPADYALPWLHWQSMIWAWHLFATWKAATAPGKQRVVPQKKNRSPHRGQKSNRFDRTYPNL
jgi:hypothetical protein